MTIREDCGMKKGLVLGFLLLFVLATVMGCTGSGGKKGGETASPTAGTTESAAASATPKKQDPVTLKIMIPGDRPANMDKVIAEAEKRMADTVNAKLDVVFIPWSDLGQKTQVTLASGEAVDLIFDAPWLHINQMITAGYYEPLEDLLQKYGQNVLKSRPQQMWDANKFQGKIYAVPLGVSHAQGKGYYIRKDLREKYGLPEIKTYEDMIKYAYLVKQNEKNVIPIVPSGQDATKDLSEASHRQVFDYSAGKPMRTTHAFGNSFVLYYKNNDGKVYNLFDEMEPAVWDSILNARKLYQDKVIHPDVLAIKDYMQEFKSGKAAVVPANDFGVNAATQADLQKNVPGASAEYVTFYQDAPGKNISNFQQWNFISIPAVSKNKERAMQFLDWANQKENYDLLAYGIEGEDWEAVGDDQYKVKSDKYSYFPYAWIWNPTHDRLDAGQDARTLELNKFLKVADNFTTDILKGFTFDTTPVKNEMTQYSTIEAKYYTVIFNGVMEPEEYWNKFKAEAAPAAKKIQNELQKQIDAYLSANK